MNSSIWILLITLAFGQETIGVEAKPRQTEVPLAHPVAIAYTIRSGNAVKIDLTSWKTGQTQWGDFTLWDFHSKEGKDGDKKITMLDVALMAFKIGDMDVPSLEIPAQGTIGQTTVVKTPPVHLKILDPTHNAKNPAELRDIKRPRKPLYFWEKPWVIAGFSVGGILGILALLWFLRSRHKIQAQAGRQAQSKLSAEETFERDLAALIQMRLLESRKNREFYFALSEIYRKYLDRRFSLDTQSLTSAELTRLLHRERQSLGVDLPAVIRLKESLEITDLAKFAKYAPDDGENAHAVTILKEFVEAHRARPAPAAEPENAATQKTA
ncbi:MAG: hypothetical protein AAB091_06085 [Elusimicrobiota bacterium]